MPCCSPDRLSKAISSRLLFFSSASQTVFFLLLVCFPYLSSCLCYALFRSQGNDFCKTFLDRAPALSNGRQGSEPGVKWQLENLSLICHRQLPWPEPSLLSFTSLQHQGAWCPPGGASLKLFCFAVGPGILPNTGTATTASVVLSSTEWGLLT